MDNGSVHNTEGNEDYDASDDSSGLPRSHSVPMFKQRKIPFNLRRITRKKGSRYSIINHKGLKELVETEDEMYRGVLMPYKKILQLLSKWGLIRERTKY